MNKFRTFLIGITVAAAAGCLCGAAACNRTDGGSNSSGVVDEDPPAYYKLDLKGSGIDIVFDGDLAELDDKGEGFRFGGSVKEGVEVRFKVLVGSHATGTPQVSLAWGSLLGETLTPDADGFYAFTMESDATISVTGLKALYTLKFPKSEEVTSSDGQIYREERRIKFFDEQGKEITDDVSKEAGSNYKFKLWISPYYEDSYTVSCGFEVLKPDEDGFYTVNEISADGEINVGGLTLQEGFATFDDGRYGDGSAEHPFELRKPIDLYYLASIVNDDFYGGSFAGLHYKLMNDIDMQGEQLYVIGDNSTEVSAFSGTFDGNGHTIKNFFITDEVYDQETYQKEYLPYVGLFGYAVATVSADNQINAPVIKNLTLKDYSVRVHPATAGEGTFVGSIVGWGIGVEMTNCRAESGTGVLAGNSNLVKGIMVINDNNQIINAGGLIGRLQGAYGTTARGEVSHGAFVSYSSANVFMEGTGSPHSAGGVVGYLVSADESAIAYAYNCYSQGSINGAMNAGGIVGTLGRFSTVANCYSTAQIFANNDIEGLVVEEFKGAYAGGIAGFAEENTVIAGCYSANYTSASVNVLSAHSKSGANYAKTGAFAGYYAKLDPATSAHAADHDELIEFNNQTAVANPSESTFTALGWYAGDWNFTEGALPRINAAATPRTVTVKIKNGSTQVKTASVAGYMPLSDWFKKAGGITEYDQNAQGHRSWGYYFDEEMTKKVPCGFVPVTTETELYVGYADYSQAAGTYYVEETAYSNGAYIKLNADGTAEIRNGGLYYECTYAYDGEKVIIYRSCLAALAYTESEINGGYFAYGGTLEDGTLDLSAYLTLLRTSGSAEQVSYVNEVATISAVKASEGFVYGEYKDESGAVYLFRRNGTGVMTSGNTSSAFTFTPAGNEFMLTFDRVGNEASGRSVAVTLKADKTVDTINAVSVSKIDGFKGSWKKNANSSMEFTFDGEGNVALNGGSAVQYTDAGNGAVGFTIGEVTYKATLNNGTLVINGENYFVSDGFTGEWFMFGEKEQFRIALDGIGVDGYGSAIISYTGGEAVDLEAEYDVFVAQDGRHLRLYVGDSAYGDLVFDKGSNTAAGSFYSALYGEFRTYTFNIYDVLYGVWTGNSDDFDIVTFNGRSAAAGSSEVAVRKSNNSTLRGTYEIKDGKNGTMTVGGKTYNITYSEAKNRISFTEAVTEQPVSGMLGQRDGWQGVVLYANDGTSYTFDGKSNVGGNVKVSDGTKLAYTIGASGTVTVDGKALTATASGFGWNGTTLKFKSGFADDWVVSNSDTVLTISEVSGYLTADVAGKTYVYDIAEKTLTLTEGEDITVIALAGDSEMSITRTHADGTSENLACVRSASADKWRGVYTAADGSSWKFDGLGSCLYGSGTATYTPAEGDPVNYVYSLNALGNPYIRAEKRVAFMLAGVGESGYVNDGKTYKTVEVDIYYGRTVKILGDTKVYFFDGMSNVWVKPGAATEYTQIAYTYEIVTALLCELIDENGVRHNGEMSTVGATIRLKVTDQITATANGVTYAFGVSTLWAVTDGEYTKAYTFTATETEGVYELTNADGDKFTAKLTAGENGNTLEITPVETTPEQGTEEQA